MGYDLLPLLDLCEENLVHGLSSKDDFISTGMKLLNEDGLAERINITTGRGKEEDVVLALLLCSSALVCLTDRGWWCTKTERTSWDGDSAFCLEARNPVA